MLAIIDPRVPDLAKLERWRVGFRGGVGSQLENLIRCRHFDASVGKMCRELPQDVFFAVNEERSFCAGLLLPSQQLRLVGIGGKTINGVDSSPNL